MNDGPPFPRQEQVDSPDEVAEHADGKDERDRGISVDRAVCCAIPDMPALPVAAGQSM